MSKRFFEKPLFAVVGIVAIVCSGVGCASAGASLRPVSDVTAPTARPTASTSGAVGAPNPVVSRGAVGAPNPAVSGGAVASSPGVAVAPLPAPAPAVAAQSGVVGSAQALPPTVTSAPSATQGITVSGSGTVTAQPDQAIVTTGVQTRAANAQDAQSQNNQAMQAAIAAIKALNIPSQNIQTTGVNLDPVYSEGQFVTGYNASNSVTVTIDDVTQAGAVLDAAVRAGANQTSGVRFSLKDPSALRNKALAAAATDARSKATALASALGLQISGIQSVSEQSVGGPIYTEPRLAAAAPSQAVPIEPGQLTVSAQVTIVFSY